MPLSIGDKLGPYEILAPIGAGGMGEVYKARDPRLKRDVAIKQLKSQHTARFQQEAHAIAALNHSNICQIYDIGPDYLVMEYIEGRPLSGPLRVEEAARLAVEIAGAMEEAHSKGILHRDLKPANILVTKKGSVKLLDFGLSKSLYASDSDTTQTLAGTILGTAAYMSPEQAKGQEADARSDVFSFGLVLYEMLSGRQAFAKNSAIETMAAIVRDEPSPLDTAAKLSAIVNRCLRKSPAERFQTMSEVRASIQQAVEPAGIQPPETLPSIAVLPFANMSADRENEYFSDGLAEEILNLLAKIPGLKVIARTSSFAFRGKEQDIRKIAETLSVSNVLEGSVRRSGNRIRVTAQLIQAADGAHLWSERYDRELTDVFEVQDEIAAAIAGALKLQLANARAPARRHQPSLPAYEAFLKGRHQLLKSSADALTRAKEYFEQAIALDPQYPEPRAELGSCYIVLASQGLRPVREMVSLAREEAKKTLDLDPAEPRAHVVLCGVAVCDRFDWKLAGEHFRLAMAAQPVPPEVRARCALYYLIPLGRFREGLREMEKMLEQDPLSTLFRSVFSLFLGVAGEYERALVEARKGLEIDENLWMTYYAMGLSHAALGAFAEARASIEKAMRLAPWIALLRGVLAGLLTHDGEVQRAAEILEGPGTTAMGMVLCHCFAGNIDGAIEAYSDAIEQRDTFAPLLASAVFFKPLRESPRWPTLARKMNLPEGIS